MNDAFYLLLGVAFLAGLGWLGLLAYGRVRAWHLRRVGYERAAGNLALRRRLAGHVAGGAREWAGDVARAEHMYGWVWVVTRLRPRQEWEGRVDPRMPRLAQAQITHREEVGWALTRGAAHRALARRLYDEAGETNIVLMVLGLLVLAAAFTSGQVQRIAVGILNWLGAMAHRLIDVLLSLL